MIMTNALAKSVRFSTFVYCLLSFSIVTITHGSAGMPLGFFFAGFIFGALDQPPVLIAVAPFVILFVSVLIASIFWRSVLFIVGLVLLTTEWFWFVKIASSHPWFSILTSLPYLGVVSYWTAISLNVILRRPKQCVFAQSVSADGPL
jgi:hypothetical protein